jgi:protein SCO1
MSRGFVPLLGCVLLIGFVAFACGTEGFRVMTSEGARRLAIARAPPPVPHVVLVDQDGVSFSLDDYHGKTLLIEFIYTRCPMLCGVLGDDFNHVLSLLEDAASNRNIELLSIGFDSENDNREALKLYGDRYGATAPRWRIAAPIETRDLAALLQTFGVVVIPDGMGGFVHNSAIYLVDGSGRLVRIIDADAPPQLVATAVGVSPR